MDQSSSSTLSVELKLLRARNICVQSREVFVRCYLSTQNNKRVRIDTQQIPSNNPNFTLNQTFSLNLFGNEGSINSLMQGTIIFELRSRSYAHFLARISGSKLLARAEMPWSDIVSKPNMEIEKWVVMIPKKNHVYIDDVKPPGVQIAMKVEEAKQQQWRDKCGCVDCGCNRCVDYDFFAFEAALDSF